MTAALQTLGLSRRFGGLTAAAWVDFTLPRGARQALIGPNGAGKTTFVNLLSGALRADAGRILLEGRDITRATASARARMGLSRSFQINQIFPSLTATEAVALAVAERGGADVAAKTAALIDRLGLAEVRDTPARRLGYGQQRLLELAIALAGRPRVLLLDEPAAGLSESERRGLLARLSDLPPEVSVLMIEHDMELVFSFADRISVMVDGRILAEGPPAEIAADPRVRAVYLGGCDG